MNIYFLSSADFGTEDITEAFEAFGHKVIRKDLSIDDLLSPTLGEMLLPETENAKADLLFTFNYYPRVAVFCKEQNLRYVSWVYDCPAVSLYSYTVIFPTNKIFVFDPDTYAFFHANGIGTVDCLPLAANPERLLKVAADAKDSYGKGIRDPKSITFVGSLYTEEHCFYDRMKDLAPHTRGFLEGLMAAQKKLYGCNLIGESLSEDLIAELQKSLPLYPDKDSTVSARYLFSEYVLNRKITQTERTELLSLLGKEFPVDLYTREVSAKVHGCRNHGPAHSQNEAPAVFASTAVNLNISLRSIVNGIPLRVFEIMGSGGFVLSNYQGDLERFFVSGEELDLWSSPEELLEKTRYYLEHPEKRKEIAQCGLEAVKKSHTYLHRIPVLLGEGS